MQFLPINRAILSVTDKAGLVEFASYLLSRKVDLVSTGGTRARLVDAGLDVAGISQLTGFPEILGGRVKTLHPKVHAGILADKDDDEHLKTIAGHGIAPFDLICVNLYDFAGAAAQGLSLKEAVERIDIGGPTLLRAGAKNYHSVLVVPDPAHYPAVRAEMVANRGAVSLDFRRRMAAETFDRVSRYDRLVADYLASHQD